jgi:antirestriction protein ArdC
MKKSHQERRDIHAEITGKMLAQLQAGTIPWLKPWNTTAGYSGFPRNAISKRAYSGVNVLILWCEADEKGYSSSEWLTFKQALDRGGHVRKGEQGTQIVLLKRLEKTEVDETGNEETKSFSMLRTFSVFNTEQCDGLNLKGAEVNVVPEATEDGLDKTFMEAVAATQIKIRHGGSSAHYAPATDHVQMPNVKDFRDVGCYQSTLAHELGHASGAKHRLNREPVVSGKGFGTPSYAFEELTAELCAAFTCAEFGLKGELRHADYLGHWIQVLKNDNKAIFSAASKASKAVAFLYPDVKQDDNLQQAA